MTLKDFLILLAILAAFVFVGGMDYQDAREQECRGQHLQYAKETDTCR